MTASAEVPPAQGSETPATPVFAAPIRHPSAWTVADFRSPADYSVDLDAAQLRDLAAAMRRIRCVRGNRELARHGYRRHCVGGTAIRASASPGRTKRLTGAQGRFFHRERGR